MSTHNKKKKKKKHNKKVVRKTTWAARCPSRLLTKKLHRKGVLKEEHLQLTEER